MPKHSDDLGPTNRDMVIGIALVVLLMIAVVAMIWLVGRGSNAKDHATASRENAALVRTR